MTQIKAVVEGMNAFTPPLEWIIASGREVTQADLDAIANNAQGYANRERIPEPLLVYSDLYHELTGQEMLKMDLNSYIEVFQEWKDRALQPNDIRGAWVQSKSDKGGFFVGHPRALTVTANGMKSKSMPAITTINTKAVERTQKLIEEKVKTIQQVTGIPEAEREKMREWKAKLAVKGFTK